MLPPLSNSWMILIIQMYRDLKSSPIIDCDGLGAVPKV